MDEEREALKLRKGDLDHIVDEVSEDEGIDEEEAVRARVDMEIREDRERTKAVIAAVTEGHDATRKRNKGKYSFDRLVADRKKERIVDPNGEGEMEEELDEEEMLIRGMKDKLERERASRSKKQYNSDSDSDEEESSDTENNIYDIMGKS